MHSNNIEIRKWQTTKRGKKEKNGIRKIRYNKIEQTEFQSNPIKWHKNSDDKHTNAKKEYVRKHNIESMVVVKSNEGNKRRKNGNKKCMRIQFERTLQ